MKISSSKRVKRVISSFLVCAIVFVLFPISKASASGQYNISENTVYTHSLTSASDYNTYVCQITASGTAEVFIDSSSSINYMLTVGIYDASFNSLYEEESYVVDRSVYGGQRIRVNVSSGQYIVLLAQFGGGTFSSNNSYDFGVLRFASSVGDIYENNDNPSHAVSLGTLTSNVSTLSSNPTLDNYYDVDWYYFTFNNTNGSEFPVIYLGGGGNDVDYKIFTNQNGSLVPVTAYESPDSDRIYVKDTSTKTYFLAVYSSSHYMGSYALGHAKEKIYQIEKAVYATLSATGDEGTQNYANMTLQTARGNASGTVTITDSRGNPVSNFPVNVYFLDNNHLTYIFDGYLSSQSTVTGSDGVASFSLGIPINASTMPVPSHYSGGYEYYYDFAKVSALLMFEGYNNLSGSQALQKDFYHYGGRLYVG